MPSVPVPITRPKQMLVEGRDEEEFFKALLRYLGIDDIEVRHYGGKNSFRRFLNGFVSTPDFDGVESMGIVRDADDSATSAFQSLKDSLTSVNLPVPDKEMIPTTEFPKVTVFIMPGDAAGGALEDLCLRALWDDPAMNCVSEYMKCIQEHSCQVPKNPAKARMHAFLASRVDPELRLGEAAQRGYLPWGDSAFVQVIEFAKAI